MEVIFFFSRCQRLVGSSQVANILNNLFSFNIGLKCLIPIGRLLKREVEGSGSSLPIQKCILNSNLTLIVRNVSFVFLSLSGIEKAWFIGTPQILLTWFLLYHAHSKFSLNTYYDQNRQKLPNLHTLNSLIKKMLHYEKSVSMALNNVE